MQAELQGRVDCIGSLERHQRGRCQVMQGATAVVEPLGMADVGLRISNRGKMDLLRLTDVEVLAISIIILVIAQIELLELGLGSGASNAFTRAKQCWEK